ncbi:MAG: hypothetical protein E6Q62_01785 [Nitrosomonas sp.]|nr:MAG: hypothetical protein E6Q62_01785 [Nitrosomonas sp.]
MQTISNLDGRPGCTDRVLIDLPRADALTVMKALTTTATPPQKVVYVSFNPTIFACDEAIWGA